MYLQKKLFTKKIIQCPNKKHFSLKKKHIGINYVFHFKGSIKIDLVLTRSLTWLEHVATLTHLPYKCKGVQNAKPAEFKIPTKTISNGPIHSMK